MTIRNRFPANRRNSRLRSARSLAALLAAATLFVGTATACSVPVFRYALEKWASDPYQVVIFHQGELSAELRAAVDRLGGDAADDAARTANVRARTVDLSDAPEAELLALWKEQKNADPPWMVVRYPHPMPDVWSGPLTAERVEQLLDSPARREIARRLLRGETAVWLLLESGDGARDDAAFDALQASLAKSQKTLKLPEIKEQDIAQGLVSIDPTELKIAFSTLRMSRNDPAEALFVEMLLGSEEDLRDLDEPMAFPVFGRGRVLYALVGAGINAETIAEANSTLVGECTCQVKEQNPGIDLVTSIDWDHLVKPQIDLDKALPPLVGVASLLSEKQPESGAAGGTDSSASPQEAAAAPAASGSAHGAGSGSAGGAPSSADAASRSHESSTVLRAALVAAGVILAAVIAMSAFLFTRKT